MAPQSISHPAARQLSRCWLLILLASAVGVVAGAGACAKGATALVHSVGTCTRPDGTVVGTRMTQADCQSTCPTCTWTQD